MHATAMDLRAARRRLRAEEAEEEAKKVTHPHLAEHLRKRTSEARRAVENLESKLAQAAASFGFQAPASR